MTEKNPTDNLQMILASTLYGAVRSAVSLGVDPATALRLVSFAIIEDSLGRDATEKGLGVAGSTARRWRLELASMDADNIPEHLEVEMVNELLSGTFPDLRLVKRKPKGGEKDD